MKKEYISLMAGMALLLGNQLAHAQLVIDGATFNNYGSASNRGIYTAVTATAPAAYTASSGAVFNHYETDANSLRVNNSYNANGTGGSTDNFNGPAGVAGVQGISGSVAPNFSTLALKNGAASAFNITNTAGANVFVIASFENGITTTVRANTTNGALRFQAGATYTGGLTDAQHVDGYVSKIGNSTFIFPVGNSSDLRTLRISAPANAAHISVAYAPDLGEAPNTPSPSIKRVYTFGSWDWVAVTPATNDLDVTVSIPNVSGFESTAANLRLVGWDGSQWLDLSGAANATGTVENSTLTGVVPAGAAITQIAIGSTQELATTPDLRPFIIMSNVTFSNTETVRPFTVRVRNMRAGTIASDPITVRIYKPTPTSTIALNGASATEWTITNSGTYYTLTTNSDIAASTPLGNSITANLTIPAATGTGGYGFRAFIPDLSGGEVVADNSNNNLIIQIFKN